MTRRLHHQIFTILQRIVIRDSLAAPAGVTHYIHDIFGNVIAETAGGGAAGASGVLAEPSYAWTREYVWLYETEIAPTFGSRTTVDRPLAVVNGVNTASPATWAVHVDHLNRPVKMTDGSKAAVWTAVWSPWGAAHAITGSATLNARFPGQWFQVEAGLHYNWHRHYDPSLGRYTQADPLGFVDGPSVYGYVGGSPAADIDPTGQHISALLKLAYKLCKKNPKCGQKLSELGNAAKNCRCKIEKHGAHHYFPGLGYCEHYQLICYIKGQRKSGFSHYWPLPGRCFPTKQGGGPSQSFPPQEGDIPMVSLP